MSIEDLHEYTDVDLILKLQLPDEEFEKDWLVPLGLLNGSKICECGSAMKEVTDSKGAKVYFVMHGGIFGFQVWRCNRRTPLHSKGKLIGYKVGTFFEHAHLSCKQIWRLSYYWSMNLPIEYAEFQTGFCIAKINTFKGIRHATVVDFYRKCRRICIEYFRRNPPKFGGPNVVVECDETYFSRAHGGKGRRVRQHPFWTFGIAEHGILF
jgi:hypothetical protein